MASRSSIKDKAQAVSAAMNLPYIVIVDTREDQNPDSPEHTDTSEPTDSESEPPDSSEPPESEPSDHSEPSEGDFAGFQCASPESDHHLGGT